MRNEKNILVTGACGFIGKHLVVALLKGGFRVMAFDVEDAFTEWKELKTLLKKYKDRIEIYKGSTEEMDSLRMLPKDVFHVIHLAARSFVPESWKNPIDFYKTNVLGTANVLELCKENNYKQTYISSYVYGKPEYLPIDELHPLKSYNPYSRTKAIAEELCEQYKLNADLKITIIRPFNIYGPGQSESFVIPEIIAQLLDKNIDVIEVNDLKPKRDYVFIDDVVEALILSINGKEDIYNIGAGFSVSVEDIIKLVLKISNNKKPYVSRGEVRTNEVDDVVANIDKSIKELKWMPKVGLEEGLEKCLMINYKL